MLLLTILTLALLVILNYRLGKNVLVYPPAVFCLVWMAGLVVIGLAGDFFYPLSPDTLFIFLSGAVAFSVGSTLGLFWPLSRHDSRQAPSCPPSDRVLNVLVLLALCGFPFAVIWMARQVANHPAGNFLTLAALTMLDQSLQENVGYRAYGNLVTFASIAAFISFCEYERGRIRAVVTLGLAAALNLLSAGRALIVVAILAFFCIDWLKNRRIRWKMSLALALAFLIVVTLVAIYLGKVGASPEASLGENIRPLINGIVLYAAGGMVGFDRVIRDPAMVEHNWQISTFFLQTLNKFGTHFAIPPLNSQFVAVGPDSLVDNVYTAYFAYIDLGLPGLLAVLAFLGVVTTLFYRKAMRGSGTARILYGALFAGLVLSLGWEFFFMYLNFLVKLYAVCWLVYSSPSWLARLNRQMRRLAPSNLASSGGGPAR